MLVKMTYMNPIMEAYSPAMAIEFGTEINDIPTYNLHKFAIVDSGPEVLILLVLVFRW